MNLKLTDIMWEITPKCNRGCNYCGSKKILQCKQMCDGDILKIAENIYSYISKIPEPKNITLTGGEPLLISMPLLRSIVTTLRDAKCTVSVITNGDLLQQEHLDLFDNVGISINAESDVNTITDSWLLYEDYQYRITFITNFGLHNFFVFDSIDNFINNVDGLWQLQLTMGDSQLSKNGIKHLYEKINDCDTKYVLADNLQVNHTCMAGFTNMSITYDGYCEPCISARAWGNEMQKYYDTKYNLLRSSLQDAWENGFKRTRFCSDECDNCRNHIDYPKNIDCPIVNRKDVQTELEKMQDQIDELTDDKKIDIYPQNPFDPWKPWPKNPITEPTITVYAAFPYHDYMSTCKNIAYSISEGGNDNK